MTGPSEFQAAIGGVAGEASSKTGKMLARLDRLDAGEARAFVTEAYPEVITPYLALSSEMTTHWYDQRPGGVKGFFASPAELAPREQLEVSARWSLTQRNPGVALQGSATRGVMDHSRRTVADNAEREGIRWTREARADACHYCRVLATRALTVFREGAPGLYRSEATARRGGLSHMDRGGHDHCRCILVPVRDGNYSAPDYVEGWLQDYDDARDAGASNMREITRFMRAREAQGAARSELSETIVGLDEEAAAEAPTVGERVAQARQAIDEKIEQVTEFAENARESVYTVQEYVVRADDVISTAADITANVKKVTDVADKVLGSAVPTVRNIKVVVDAADKALQGAAQISEGAARVANLATQTLDRTVGVAQAVKAVAGNAGTVLDETTLVAIGVRHLLADGAKALRSKAGGDVVAGLVDQIGAAAQAAVEVHNDGLALVNDAREIVAAARGLARETRDVPEALRGPLDEVRRLARRAEGAAAELEVAGEDTAGAARAMQRLADAVADLRAAEQSRPIRVRSERLDAESFDLPERQRALGRTPLKLDAGRTPTELVAGPKPQLALESAPERLAIEAPKVKTPEPGAIAEWLEAEQAHRDALEWWRLVDETRALPAGEAIADVVPAVDKALDAIVDPTLAAAVDADQAAAAVARTRGDKLREALAEAERIRDLPDDRITAQGRTKSATTKRRNRALYNEAQVKKARAELDAAIADGTVDDPLVVKVKRAKSRPFTEVEAEARAAADAEIESAVNAFEEAVATGDDALITAAADHMEALEAAEDARRVVTDAKLAKIAERSERQRARREAERLAEQDEIARVMEELGGGEFTDDLYQHAEAQVVAKRTGKSEQQVLESIRRRDFVARSSFKGNGFEDTLKNEFAHLVEQAYMQAEDATTFMVKKQYSVPGTKNFFDPVNLWYADESVARRVMTEEMANWFDANGRITLPVMRSMILDGDTNFARRTVLTQDFNQ